MKFGKLKNVDGVDLTLPPLTFHQKNKDSEDSLTVYLGTSAWGHKEWKGNFFPQKTTQKGFLRAYGSRCNGVETNTTFYRTPSVDQITNWKEQVPGDFRFCPKVLQYISQSRDLGVGSERLQIFIDHMLQFGENLGTIFLQLPPYFDTKRFTILSQFLNEIPDQLSLSVEFRNESWFSNSSALHELTIFLSERNQGVVITDVAGRRDVAHMHITADYVMVRFGGNDEHPTDLERMENWLSKFSEMRKNGVKRVYFFIHQNDPLISASQILQMQKMINECEGLYTRIEKPQLKQGQLF